MGKCKFNEDWLKKKDKNGYIVSEWGKKEESDTDFFLCCVCLKKFSIAWGFDAIEQHASTRKHKEQCKVKLTTSQLHMTSLRPNEKPIEEQPSTSSKPENSQRSCVQLYSVKDGATRAEILWAMKMVVSDFPIEPSCDSIKELFSAMFPNSLPSDFSMSTTKARYLICDAIAPYFRQEMMKDYKDSYFSLCFDETCNAGSKKELQVAIKYWYPIKEMIITTHLETFFIGKATAEDIYSKLNEAMDNAQLSRKRLLMLGCDGPNVNKLVIRLMNDSLILLGRRKLADIGTCNIHTVHNAFLKALMEFGESVSDFIFQIHNFFDGWPARWEEYEILQNKLNLPKHRFIKHVSSRWLTMGPAAERVLAILGMASEQSTDMDLPAEAFSAVWVKMEVVEDGHVEGVDEDQLDDDNRNDDEDYQDSGDNSREVDETPEVQAPVRRSRRKAARPRKAKNVEEKRFHCEYCDYKALHKASLKYHMMKHLHPEPIRCTSCSYTTNHPNSLRRHVLSVHTDQDDPAILAMPDLKCKDCEYTCKFSWKLFIHRRKHVEKSFRCSLCQFTSSRKANYEKHCRTHRDKESGVYYECDKCPYVTRHEGHISRHLAVIHKEISKDANKCDFCEFSTKIRWRLNIHKKNSRQDEPIKCEFCDYKTEYNCQYKLHKSQHVADMALVASGVALPAHVHLPPNSVVKYPEPGAEGGYGADGGDPPLHNEKDFIIDSECAEVDWRSIEVGEKPGEEKPFHCILCPYKSKFKAAVQRHFQRNHTSDKSKPYKCLNCEFSTKTRDQIALHSKRSKSIFLISCKACEFTTFYKCQMAEHQKLHWRYKCKLCDFICRVSYDLNQHYTVIHLGQGFKCRFCDFKASRKGSLLNHENSHTSKRFQCGLCEYTATRRSLLFNHMKRNHAGEKPKVIITDRKFDMLKKVDETQTEVPKAPNAKEVENEIRNIIKNKLYENKLKFEGGPNDANQCDNLESKLDGDLKNDESNKFEKPFKNIEGKIDSQYKNVEDKIDSQYKNVEDKIDSQYKNVEDKIDSQYKNVDGKIDSQYEHFEGRIDSQYRNVEGKNYSEYKNIEGEVNSQHRHVEDIDSQFKNDTSKSDDQFKGESDKKVENQKMTNSYEFVLPKDDLKNETNEDVTKFENKGSVNRKYNGQIVENNFESPYNNVDRHFRNVEGYNFDQQYRAIDSQFKNSGHFFDRQYKTIDSQFKHVEGNNFDRQYTNVDSRYKNVVSQDKFETQVIIERQNEYENIYQRSIMYGAGQDPRRVGLPGNLYDMEPRPNVFYSPYK